MKRVFAIQIVVLSLLIFAGNVEADLYDNFNSYSAPQLPVTSLGDWRVFDGAVDLVGDGTGYEYYPSTGYGYYVDLVGTGDVPGVLWTPGLFLEKGEYIINISYLLANNQFNSTTPDEVSVIMTVRPGMSGNPAALPSDPTLVVDGWTDSVAPVQPFTTYQTTISLITNFDMFLHYGFYLSSATESSIGPLLDNVNIESSVVPVPGAFLLGSIGLCFAGRLLKRKK
jgi:hypothetical protein